MKREHFERGAVVASLGRNWVVWSYPRARYAELLALPITPQTGPRHRSHVRIDLHKRASVIHTLDLVPLVAADCIRIEQLPFGVIAEIELTMKRAARALELERV